MDEPAAALAWRDRLVLGIANLWALLRHPVVAGKYLTHVHAMPVLATPRSHGTLVQWRKIFDRNPAFVELADKLAARDWARRRAPELGLAEIVWIGSRPEDVPDEFLTRDYVIKANHGSGFNYFPGRQDWSRDKINRWFGKWLRRRYHGPGEWAYWQVEPKLYVERMLDGGAPLWEATFRSHDGTVSASFLSFDLKTPHELEAYFDGNDRRLPPPRKSKPSGLLPADLVLPAFFHEAKALAERMSAGFDYVRLDFMSSEGKIYFGEATVYPGSGMGIEVKAHTAPLIERAWIGTIEKSWFLSTPQPWPLSVYAGAFRKWLAVRRRELGISG